MPGIFDFLRSLFATPRPLYQPMPDVFPHLDLDEVRRRLRPVERGREMGAQDRPRPDAEILDYVEREIVGFFEEERNRCLEIYDQQLRAYRESVGALDSQTAASQIAAEKNRTIGNLSTLAVEGRNRLHREISRTRNLATDLRRFKEENGLSREARYPEAKWFYWGVLAAFILIETGFNGLMFARGSPFGLLGGAFEAIFFALANVTLGYSLGRHAFPNAAHRRILKRLAGSVAVVLLLALAVVFNLAVGHYRDAMAIPPYDDAAARALSTLRSDPSSLADLTSWMLFAFGLVFNLGAALDAWKMDDPYPGYGSLHRDYERAHQDYTEAVREVYEHAKELRDSGDAKLDAIAQRATLNMQQQQTLIARSTHLQKKFSQHQDYLERSCQSLLEEYRQANQLHRKSAPPLHFRAEYAMMRVDLPSIEPASVSKELASTLKSAHDEIAAAYKSTIDEFATVEKLTGAA